MLSAGAEWRIERGWRIQVAESMSNKAAPVIGTRALFARVARCWVLVTIHADVVLQGNVIRIRTISLPILGDSNQ